MLSPGQTMLSPGQTNDNQQVFGRLSHVQTQSTYLNCHIQASDELPRLILIASRRELYSIKKKNENFMITTNAPISKQVAKLA